MISKRIDIGFPNRKKRLPAPTNIVCTAPVMDNEAKTLRRDAPLTQQNLTFRGSFAQKLPDYVTHALAYRLNRFVHDLGQQSGRVCHFFVDNVELMAVAIENPSHE